jgi:hypothetical protein
VCCPNLVFLFSVLWHPCSIIFCTQASGNNYQLIFLMAASVSLASCLAFVLLVPNHARPVQKVPEHSSESPAGNSQTQGPTTASTQGLSLSKIWRDVMSMGSDFYRMLVVVGLYCSAHINEVSMLNFCQFEGCKDQNYCQSAGL